VTSLATTPTAPALGFVAGRVRERAARAWGDCGAREAEVPFLGVLAPMLSAKAAGWVLIEGVAAWSLYTRALSAEGPGGIQSPFESDYEPLVEPPAQLVIAVRVEST